MPVIQIRTLPQDDSIETVNVLKKVCAAVAREMNYQPSHVWGTWDIIPPHHYAVGNYSVPLQPQSTHGPLVRVVSFEGKTKKDVEAVLRTIAEVLSEELKIDAENIFIEYTEVKSGRIFDGGQVIY